MSIYKEYIDLFEDFQAINTQTRSAIFIQKLVLESDPSAWIRRLEHPGFSEIVSNILKEYLGTQLNNGPFQQFQQ